MTHLFLCSSSRPAPQLPHLLEDLICNMVSSLLAVNENGDSAKGVEVNRHIIQAIEGSIAFHGVDHPGRTTSEIIVVGQGAISMHATGIPARYSAQAAGKWETGSADTIRAASTSFSRSRSTAVNSPGL